MGALLLQTGFARQEKVIRDFKSLTEKMLVQTDNLEEICTKDFLRLVNTRPKENIISTGFIGGGYYPLSPVLHKGNEGLGFFEEMRKTMEHNGYPTGSYVYEYRLILYVYSEGNKRGTESVFGLWEIIEDKKGIFVHSPFGFPQQDPVCVTAATYAVRPAINKRLPICTGGMLGSNVVLGKEKCVLERDREDHLNRIGD